MHTYTLSEGDLLAILIYDFSTDPKKAGRRKKSIWIIVTCFTLLGIAAYFTKDIFLSVLFIVIALLSLFFGNAYLIFAYKTAFRKTIKNDLSGMIGAPIQVTFESDHIHVIDKVGDANFRYSQMLRVSEITDYFIIKLSSGLVLGVPKISEALKSDIKNMVSSCDMPYQVDLNWKL